MFQSALITDEQSHDSLSSPISMKNGCNDMTKLFSQSTRLRNVFILVGRGNDKNLETNKINSTGDKCYRNTKIPIENH